MGLFASRPEEPTEWAGLPSEPLDTGSPVERLEAPVTTDIGDLLGDAVHSIRIPAVPPVEPGGAD